MGGTYIWNTLWFSGGFTLRIRFQERNCTYYNVNIFARNPSTVRANSHGNYKKTTTTHTRQREFLNSVANTRYTNIIIIIYTIYMIKSNIIQTLT